MIFKSPSADGWPAVPVRVIAAACGAYLEIDRKTEKHIRTLTHARTHARTLGGIFRTTTAFYITLYARLVYITMDSPMTE